jgi:hypothetical protein
VLIQLKESELFNYLAICPSRGKGCIVVGVTQALKENTYLIITFICLESRFVASKLGTHSSIE